MELLYSVPNACGMRSVPGERGGRRVRAGARHGGRAARGGRARLAARRQPARAARLPGQRRRQAAPPAGRDQARAGIHTASDLQFGEIGLDVGPKWSDLSPTKIFARYGQFVLVIIT